MPILNNDLNVIDFMKGTGGPGWTMRAGDQYAFEGQPEVVTLPSGFQLYKLTGDGAKEGKHGVTPWWSSVKPYRRDFEGAKGRFLQAQLNGIDMSSMARYMSAVVVNWNVLSEYVEVSIAGGWEVKCFWGRFASQRLSQADVYDPAQGKSMKAIVADSKRDLKSIRSVSGTHSPGYQTAVLPEEIGVLEAWQFYIPGLKDEHLAGGAHRCAIDAHDMDRLAAHFGVEPAAPSVRRAARMPSPAEFMKATRFSQVQARHPLLLQADACLTALDRSDPPPRALNPRSPRVALQLRQFIDIGDRYATVATEPRMVKARVADYVSLARSWLA